MEKIYSEIESDRREYFNFYNDYRRGGVGEGEYIPKKEKKPRKCHQDEQSGDKSILKDIFAELVTIKDLKRQADNKEKMKNGWRIKCRYASSKSI